MKAKFIYESEIFKPKTEKELAAIPIDKRVALAIKQAIGNGNKEIVQNLLKNNKKIDIEIIIPALNKAADDYNYDMVDLLLSDKRIVDHENEPMHSMVSMLAIIADTRKDELEQILKKHNVKTDRTLIDYFNSRYNPKPKKKPMFGFLRKNESMESILKPKGKEEIENIFSTMPKQQQFMNAVSKGLIDKVRTLINDPDVDPVYLDGNAIYTAVEKNYPDILDMILNSGERAIQMAHKLDVLLWNEAVNNEYTRVKEVLKKHGLKPNKEYKAWKIKEN